MNRNESGVDQCFALIREMTETVASARRTLVNADSCIISRKYLTDCLDQLRRLMPESMREAERIISEEAEIRARTAQDCSDALHGAQDQARNMIAEAQEKVNKAQEDVRIAGEKAQRTIQEAQQRAQEEGNRVVQQANQEAAAIRNAANQEAAAIHAKAEQDRDEMISHENVFRMATVEAEELRESTRKEMLQMRQNTFDYLDNVMGEVDRYLATLSNELRMERNELNNHR